MNKQIIEVVQVSDQLEMIKYSDRTIDFHRIEPEYIKELDDEYRELTEVIQEAKKNNLSYVEVAWYDKNGYLQRYSLSTNQSEWFISSHYPLDYEDVDFLLSLVSDHITFDDEYKEKLMCKLKQVKGIS